MLQASDLIEQQKKREKNKIVTFNKIYEKIEKKIQMASNVNCYQTWYQVPEFIIGLPLYNLNDCCDFINKKLNNNGFKTTYYEPNFIIISWNS